MVSFRSIPYVALSASLLLAGGVSAQSMGSIDAREGYQQDRIDRGIRDGSLTRGEAARLERGEQRIERYEQRARADGVVTSGERQRLDGMLDREGRAIGRETHDGQRADGRGDRDGWGNRDGWGSRGNWDGNRNAGFERRDAQAERRLYDGARDGSLSRGEFTRLERGQERIDR